MVSSCYSIRVKEELKVVVPRNILPRFDIITPLALGSSIAYFRRGFVLVGVACPRPCCDNFDILESRVAGMGIGKSYGRDGFQIISINQTLLFRVTNPNKSFRSPL